MDLTFYDLSNYHDGFYINNAKATTVVSNYVGKNLSIPDGTVHVTLDNANNYTHFKATIQGKTYVFRIIKKTWVANNVYDCDYTIDGCRTYGLSHSMNDLFGCIVLRTSDKTEWGTNQKFISDPLFNYTNDLNQTVSKISFSNWGIGLCMNVVNSAVTNPQDLRTAYVFSPSAYKSLQDKILSQNEFDLGLDTSYSSSFVIPEYASIVNNAGEQPSATVLLRYMSADDLEVRTKTIPIAANRYDGTTGWHFDKQMPSFVITDYTIADTLHITCNIPFIGNIEIPFKELLDAGDNLNTVWLRFYVNIWDGTIAVTALKGAKETGILGTGDLPRVTFASTKDSYDKTQFICNTASSLFGAASSISAPSVSTGTNYTADGMKVTGQHNYTNITGGSGAGLVSGILNTVGNGLGILNGGVNYNGQSTGWSGYLVPYIFVAITYSKSIYDADNWAEAGAGYVINKPILNMGVFKSGAKYWIDAQNLSINETQEVVDAIKSELAYGYKVNNV